VVGLLWRLLAPRPLRKARRALHPSWVIEDAIVRGVRGSNRRRRARRRRRTGREGRVYDPEMAARPQTYRATLKFPDGDQVCCAAGHPAKDAARRHGEQIAAARGYDGVDEEDPQP
jgi:hypothetical protein